MIERYRYQPHKLSINHITSTNVNQNQYRKLAPLTVISYQSIWLEKLTVSLQIRCITIHGKHFKPNCDCTYNRIWLAINLYHSWCTILQLQLKLNDDYYLFSLNSDLLPFWERKKVHIHVFHWQQSICLLVWHELSALQYWFNWICMSNSVKNQFLIF